MNKAVAMVILGDVVFWQANSEKKKKKKNQAFLTGEEVKSYSTEGIILPNGRE